VFWCLLVPQRYDQQDKMSMAKIGDQIDTQSRKKYKLKTLCVFDYDSAILTSRRRSRSPRDLRGAKIRVAAGHGVRETINGLGGQRPLPIGVGRGDLGPRQVRA